MNTPHEEAIVSELVSLLDANCREEFEERAGIIEFEANQPRAHAECLALLHVLKRHPLALAGSSDTQVATGKTVTFMQVEITGVTHWVLTTNPALVHQKLRRMNGRAIASFELADAVGSQFGGMAMLTPVR